MSVRTSHRRAAGKKCRQRQEKIPPAEKWPATWKNREGVSPRGVVVRFPDKNDESGVFDVCEKCFRYALTLSGKCLECSLGGVR